MEISFGDTFTMVDAPDLVEESDDLLRSAYSAKDTPCFCEVVSGQQDRAANCCWAR